MDRIPSGLGNSFGESDPFWTFRKPLVYHQGCICNSSDVMWPMLAHGVSQMCTTHLNPLNLAAKKPRQVSSSEL